MAGLYVVTYHVIDDSYTLSDGSRITSHELQMNPHYLTQPYLGSGAINGRYRSTNTTPNGGAAGGAHQGNTGTQTFAANQAAHQHAFYAQQATLANSYTGSGLAGYGGGIGGNSGVAGYGGSGGAGVMFVSQPPPAPVKYEGVVAGEIIAWRIWFLTDDGRLKSTYTGSIWEPGIPMTGNPVDSWYGVHAWKDKAEALKYATGFGPYSSPIAIGQVKLWGEVVEHERGYRAENAKIIELKDVLPVPGRSAGSDTKELKRLRKLYGVDGNAISNDQGEGKVSSQGGQETLDDSGRSRAPLGRYARFCRSIFGGRNLRNRIQGRSLGW